MGGITGEWSYWLRTTCTVVLKEQKQENYKRFLKRNLPNVGMAYWLTKYTNKEGTFHNIATFHTTIPP